MNKTLFFASLKANWKLLAVTFFVLLMYQSIIISMYDPENVEAMATMIKALPEAMSAAFGYDMIATDLSGYLGAYLYGFLFLVFPLIYLVPAANNMIARHVDKGSMVYMLATPNTRTTISVTQAVFLVSSTAVLLLSVVLMGILLCEIMFPGELVYGDYLLLNLVTIAVHLVLCAIGFLASCTFSESRHSIAVGVGIPVAFLLLKMMSGTSEQLEAMKYASLFTVIDIPKIFSNTGYALLSTAVLLLVTFVLIVIGIYIFDRRSLTI